METLVNNCIYVILAFLIMLSAIASANKQVASTLLTKHWYLQFKDSVTILPGEGGKFVSDFLTFLILFYNFVPLSVYITMEAVNLFHAFFIDWDASMYDARSDTAAHARTAALSEDLGQIEYIFSDKTGTLTQNVMVFRAATIAPPAEGDVAEGRTYGKVSTMDAEAKEDALEAAAQCIDDAAVELESDAPIGGDAKPKSKNQFSAMKMEECRLGCLDCLLCGDCGCYDGGACRAWAKTPFCAFVGDAMEGLGWRIRAVVKKSEDVASKAMRTRSASVEEGDTISADDFPVFDGDLRRAVMSTHDKALSERRRRISGEQPADTPPSLATAPLDVMQCLAVCHTVVPAIVELPGKGSVIRYEAESPDEGALVNAAAAYGWRLTQRTHSKITVAVRTDKAARSSFFKRAGAKTIGNVEAEEVWGVLALNKFTSARKCMSMLTRRPSDGKAVLWVKGADSVMLRKNLEGEETSPAHRERVRSWLAKELDRFARAGLRTLILGKRELSEEEVESWLTMYEEASNADDRDAALAAAAEVIERGVQLIGATGIEDKLQEGVPGTIADLAVAGIKLWVLTGDKMETAINIGRTCNLLREGMVSIELRGGEGEGVGARVAELYQKYVPADVRADAEQESRVLDVMSHTKLKLLCNPDAIKKMVRPMVHRWIQCCACGTRKSSACTFVCTFVCCLCGCAPPVRAQLPYDYEYTGTSPNGD